MSSSVVLSRRSSNSCPQMDRKLLPKEEREAVQKCIRTLQKSLEAEGKDSTQAGIGELLGGISQPAIGKALNRAIVGPVIRDALLDHFGITRAQLLEEWGNGSRLPAETWTHLHPVLSDHVGNDKSFTVGELADKLRLTEELIQSWLDGSAPSVSMTHRLVNVLAKKEGVVPAHLLKRFFGVPQTLVVRDSVSTPRYSNRERAIQLLVEDGVEQAVAEEAANRAAVALDANEDQSVLQWVEMTRPFVKAARRGDSAVGVGSREIEDDV